VYNNFNTGTRGIPGNDDSGAMASLLVFHLLGLYPVQSSTQLLLSVPFVSSYTIKHTLPSGRTSTRISVLNFDKTTLKATPPAGSNMYIQSVTVNGTKRPSVCWIGWGDVVGGGEVVIEVGPKALPGGCSVNGAGDNQRPGSLETGGFD